MTNPELRRNLWLEFSLHRVIAAPVVIALAVLLIVASDNKNPLNSIATVAAYGYVVTVLFWGAKLAGSSVIEEVRDRTWDAQRMSSITPWRMTWGKLLGAPSFAWYVGGILLLIYVTCGSWVDIPVARYAALMVCGALMLHAIALNASVLAARNGATGRGSGILIILVILFALLFLRAFVPDNLTQQMTWWNVTLPRIDFALYSAAVFGAWAVLGAYRSMCDELEIRTTPWALPSFILFTAAYLAGFATSGKNHPGAFFAVMACGVVTAMVFVYLLLPVEKSGAGAWQRLRARVRGQQWLRAGQELPLWMVALAVGLVTALAASAASVGSGARSTMSNDFLGSIGLAPIALMLFAVRDAAIFQFFALARQPRRVVAATLFYLLLLYGLLPGLLKASGAGVVAHFVLPPLTDNPAYATAVMAVQAAVATALAYARWRKIHALDVN